MGSWIKENWRQVVVIVVAAILVCTGIGAALGAALAGTLATTAAVTVAGTTVTWGAIAAGAAIGFISGGLSAALAGGDLGDVLRGAVVGGVSGALTAGLHAYGAEAAFTAGDVVNIVGHGVVGGASNVAMGGKFGDGFLSASASAATASTGLTDPNSGIGKSIGFSGRTTIASVAGGTASALGGGKFANGAVTGAMTHLLNAEGGVKGGLIKSLDVISKSPLGYIWNLPNTVIGIGLLGGTGLLSELIGFPFSRKWDFGISFANNAIQFTGHNLVGSAITIGNVIAYDKEYGPESYGPYGFMEGNENHTVAHHEIQHTYQGQMVGPLYLPLAIGGMGLDFLISGPSAGFHGEWSFMETGPMIPGQNNKPFRWMK